MLFAEKDRGSDIEDLIGDPGGDHEYTISSRKF